MLHSRCRPPDEGAVDVMESIVLAYVQDLAARAKQVSLLTKKLDKDCFLYVVRKDMRKFRRVNDLLCANEELKGVQKNALPDESSI